ncbi:uncharacterized protein LOC143845470 [Tasmannia lanceolata]|uniref:uncharacterized protein LOC143845470 n=1 Tax=Tasmannia lanceolata TaxID=3420 RepID=UPI004063C918
MAEKVSTLILDVDLDCHRCCKKIKKILSKFCDIRSQTFDRKQNKVTISGPFDPEKLAKKLRCKAGECITKIEIKEEKPKPDPPKKADPPKKDEEKPKEIKITAVVKVEGKPKEDPPKKAEEKPKPKEEPTKPVVPHPEPFRPCYPLYPPYYPAYPPYQPYVPVPVPVVCLKPYYDGYPRDGFCCKGCAEGNPRDMICRNVGGARVSSCIFFSEEDPAACTIM